MRKILFLITGVLFSLPLFSTAQSGLVQEPKAQMGSVTGRSVQPASGARATSLSGFNTTLPTAPIGQTAGDAPSQNVGGNLYEYMRRADGRSSVVPYEGFVQQGGGAASVQVLTLTPKSSAGVAADGSAGDGYAASSAGTGGSGRSSGNGGGSAGGISTVGYGSVLLRSTSAGSAAENDPASATVTLPDSLMLPAVVTLSDKNKHAYPTLLFAEQTELNKRKKGVTGWGEDDVDPWEEPFKEEVPLDEGLVLLLAAAGYALRRYLRVTC